jgi:hypothetical protein
VKRFSDLLVIINNDTRSLEVTKFTMKSLNHLATTTHKEQDEGLRHHPSLTGARQNLLKKITEKSSC